VRKIMSSNVSTSMPAPASPGSPSAVPAQIDLRRGALPLLLVSTLWGMGGLVSTLAPAPASTSAVAAAAMMLGGGLMFGCRPGARRLLRTRDRREQLLLVLGAVTVLAYHQFFFPAVRQIGVAEATVIALGGAPVFAGLLGQAVDRTPPTARWLCCAPVAVVGCTLLVAGHGSDAGLGPGVHSQVIGVVLALVPGLAFAATSTTAARLISSGHSSADVMGAMFGGAAALSAPVLAFTGVRWLADPRGLGAVLFLGLVSNCLGYILFGRALRHTSAAVATTLTLSEGAVGTLLGVAVRGEQLAPIAWCGLVLLAAALLVLCAPARTGRSVAAPATITTAPTAEPRPEPPPAAAMPEQEAATPAGHPAAPGDCRNRQARRRTWPRRPRT
jgi:drug/metabolite transporter, DME family